MFHVFGRGQKYKAVRGVELLPMECVVVDLTEVSVPAVKSEGWFPELCVLALISEIFFEVNHIVDFSHFWGKFNDRMETQKNFNRMISIQCGKTENIATF